MPASSNSLNYGPEYLLIIKACTTMSYPKVCIQFGVYSMHAVLLAITAVMLCVGMHRLIPYKEVWSEGDGVFHPILAGVVPVLELGNAMYGIIVGTLWTSKKVSVPLQSCTHASAMIMS